MYDQIAGWLTQDENGYHIIYDAGYTSNSDAEPVSLTLPLQETPFNSKALFQQLPELEDLTLYLPSYRLLRERNHPQPKQEALRPGYSMIF